MCWHKFQVISGFKINLNQSISTYWPDRKIDNKINVSNPYQSWYLSPKVVMPKMILNDNYEYGVGGWVMVRPPFPRTNFQGVFLHCNWNCKNWELVVNRRFGNCIWSKLNIPDDLRNLHKKKSQLSILKNRIWENQISLIALQADRQSEF